MHLNQDLNLIVPCQDTWGPKGQREVAWHINPPFPFKSSGTSEVNAWFIETISRTITAFSHFARVWEIRAYSSPLDEDSELLIKRYEKGSPYKKFLDEVLNHLSQFRQPLYAINMHLDLFVFVRTSLEQTEPVQGWVRNLADLDISSNINQDYGSCAFTLFQTLFQAFVDEYGNGDNQQLHFLNQPLLYEALFKWEQSVGDISDIEATLAACYKYGFSSNPSDYGR